MDLLANAEKAPAAAISRGTAISGAERLTQMEVRHNRPSTVAIIPPSERPRPNGTTSSRSASYYKTLENTAELSDDAAVGLPDVDI